VTGGKGRGGWDPEVSCESEKVIPNNGNVLIASRPLGCSALCRIMCIDVSHLDVQRCVASFLFLHPLSLCLCVQAVSLYLCVSVSVSVSVSASVSALRGILIGWTYSCADAKNLHSYASTQA